MQDLDAAVVSIKSPTDGSTSIPVLRSGSCSEIGPKSYMEDEHICIDNLLEHQGSTAHLSSPGAFYGVCNSIDATVDQVYPEISDKLVI